jgi:hypothetical protein
MSCSAQIVQLGREIDENPSWIAARAAARVNESVAVLGEQTNRLAGPFSDLLAQLPIAKRSNVICRLGAHFRIARVAL